MTQLHSKFWLNAKIGLRNNTNPVRDEGKLIAGKEIAYPFLIDTECAIPGIQELKYMQTLK